jgi:hypothetical protein
VIAAAAGPGAAVEASAGAGGAAGARASAGAGARAGGALEQAATTPRIVAHVARTPRSNRPMWLILLEALAALAVLLLIVWWTMFSGRRKGERE